MIGLLVVSLLSTPPVVGSDAHLGHLDAATRAELMAKLSEVHGYIKEHEEAQAAQRKLPLYRLKVDGRIALHRGPEPPPVGTVKVDTGGTLTFTLRPSVDAPDGIGIKAWLVPRDGDPISVSPTQSGAGAFRLRGSAAGIGLLPGLSDVVFVVGLPSELPSVLDDVGRGDCQVLRSTVLVVDLGAKL